MAKEIEGMKPSRLSRNARLAQNNIFYANDRKKPASATPVTPLSYDVRDSMKDSGSAFVPVDNEAVEITPERTEFQLTLDYARMCDLNVNDVAYFVDAFGTESLPILSRISLDKLNIREMVNIVARLYHAAESQGYGADVSNLIKRVSSLSQKSFARLRSIAMQLDSTSLSKAVKKSLADRVSNSPAKQEVTPVAHLSASAQLSLNKILGLQEPPLEEENDRGCTDKYDGLAEPYTGFKDEYDRLANEPD